MGGEAHRRGRAEVDEGVAVVGAGVFPVAFVGDVVGVEAQGYAALFAAGRVARAEVEEVVAGHADRSSRVASLRPV